MKRAIALAALALLVTTAQARPFNPSVDYKNLSTGGGLLRALKSGTHTPAMFSGYVSGVTEREILERRVCIPPGTAGDDVAAMVLGDLMDHPSAQNGPAVLAIMTSLRLHFPCR